MTDARPFIPVGIAVLTVSDTRTLADDKSGSMLADRVRTDSYAAALERTVRPGCVVLDVGTGTGMLAMLACRGSFDRANDRDDPSGTSGTRQRRSSVPRNRSRYRPLSTSNTTSTSPRFTPPGRSGSGPVR